MQKIASKQNDLPPLQLITAELCRRSLSHFIREAWSSIDPAAYVHNWHIDAIAEHLEAVSKGQIKNLLINIPPGHMKSLAVSVMWPAWEWTNRASTQFLYAAYAMDLSVRDSGKCRNLISSEWYRKTFGIKWNILEDHDRTDDFKNDMSGQRMCLSVGGKAGGWRGDIIVTDDSLNSNEAASEQARDNVKKWWNQAWYNRLNDMVSGRRVVIEQRLHEDDLSGHLLRQTSYQWVHLCLPGEFEPSRRCVTVLPWADPRKKEGELLFPARFPQVEMEKEKQTKGPMGFACQIQQSPAPEGGGLFKKAYFRYYHQSPDGLNYILHDPARGLIIVPKSSCTRRYIVADTAMTTKTVNDFTCAGGWDQDPEGNIILFWGVHDRMEDPDVEKMFEVADVTHRPLFTAIEDRGNGTTLMQRLNRKGIRTQPLKAVFDKIARSSSAQIDMANGKIYFDATAPYLADLEKELQLFPNGSHDDWVDMISYAAIVRGEWNFERIRDWGYVTIGGAKLGGAA